MSALSAVRKERLNPDPECCQRDYTLGMLFNSMYILEHTFGKSNGFTKQQNNKTIIPPRILLFQFYFDQ